jgi:hypothetical protein
MFFVRKGMFISLLRVPKSSKARRSAKSLSRIDVPANMALP